MLTRPLLVNISLFMKIAAESGQVKSLEGIMAFAETLQAVGAEIEAIDKAATPQPAPPAPPEPATPEKGS